MTFSKKCILFLLGLSLIIPGTVFAQEKSDPYKACDSFLAKPEQERVADALFELCLLDQLMNDGKWDEAKTVSDRLAKDKRFKDFAYLRGLDYRRAFINKDSSIMSQALKKELAIDMALEKSQRKKIHPSEFKSGNLESEADFQRRYAHLNQDIEMNTAYRRSAAIYRARLLLLRQRYRDCYYLCEFFTSVDPPKNPNAEIVIIGKIASMKMEKQFKNNETDSGSLDCMLYAQGMRAFLDNDIEAARKYFTRVIEQKEESTYWDFLGQIGLAECDLNERKFASAYQNYKQVYEYAHTKNKGMAHSLMYAALAKFALSGMRLSQADSINLVLNEDTDFSKLNDGQKQQFISELYDAGYKLKAAGHQENAQQLLWGAVLLYEKYFPEKKSELAGVLYDLAESYYWDEGFDPAMKLMERCVQLRTEKGENLDALDTLGRIYIAGGESKKGLTSFARLLFQTCKEIKPESLDSKKFQLIPWAVKVRKEATTEKRSLLDNRLQGMVDGFIAEKEFDEALNLAKTIKDWKEVEQKPKSDPILDSLWQIGWLCRISQKQAEARECYSKLIECYPDKNIKWLGTWHFERALTADCMGDYKSAVEDFKIALTKLRQYYKENEADMDFEEKEYLTNIIWDINLELKYKKKDPPTNSDYLRSFPMYIYHWNLARAPLRIYIDPSSKSGFGPRLKNKIDQIVKDWMNTPGLSLTWRYADSPEDCDIHIRRVSTYEEIPAGSGGRALSELVFNEKGKSKELNKSTLLIYCPSYDGKELSYYGMKQLENLVMHEFGHALGLGHSTSGLDIMYWKAPALELSQRDRNSLVRLYSK